MNYKSIVGIIFFITLNVKAETKARLQDEILKIAAKSKAATLVIYKGQTEFFSSNKEELFFVGGLTNYVVASAALAELGSGYSFPTEIFVDHLPSELDASEIRVDFKEPVLGIGDIYLRGYGDPTLDSKRITEFAELIFEEGILNLNNIVLDGSLVNDKNPITTALPFNENQILIFVAPNKTNAPAFVNLAFGTPLKVEGSIKTTFLDSLNPEDAIKATLTGTTLKLRGTIGRNSSGMVIKKDLPNDQLFLGYALKARLEQLGVKFTGTVKTGRVPKNAKSLETLNSEGLDILLKRLNRGNSEFIQNQLLIALGQDSNGSFSLQKGRERIYNYLGGVKIDPTGMDLFSSKQSSSAALMKILINSQNDLSNREVLLTSLSKFGEVGSLKSTRLLDPNLLNKAVDRTKLTLIQNNSWFMPFSERDSFGLIGIMNTETEPIFLVLIVNQRQAELNPLATISQLILLANGVDIAAPQLVP